MIKAEYLKSFLKKNQKRLPRKLKKKYSKYYKGIDGPIFILNRVQFLNLYKENK